MELTQLQWAKSGYVLNEDAVGKEQWTNCFHKRKAVYFSDNEVHPDISGAKAFITEKKKQYRIAAKQRKQKIMEHLAQSKKYEAAYDEGLPLPSDALKPVKLPDYPGWNTYYPDSKPAVLIFDTETTGLKEKYNSLLQLSWQVVNIETWEVLSRQNFYFKYPSNPYRVEEKAIMVNNLTTDRLSLLGTSSLQSALHIFNQDLKGCSMIVGHNLLFDTKFIAHAAICINENTGMDLLPNLENPLLKSYCIMLSTVDLCKIPQRNNPGEYKRPKLIELAAYLGVGTNDLNLHDSACDVELSKRCFMKLVKMNHNGISDLLHS